MYQASHKASPWAIRPDAPPGLVSRPAGRDEPSAFSPRLPLISTLSPSDQKTTARTLRQPARQQQREPNTSPKRTICCEPRVSRRRLGLGPIAHGLPTSAAPFTGTKTPIGSCASIVHLNDAQTPTGRRPRVVIGHTLDG
jgi:hypothetical protein